jgi:hypothetical protein
VPGTARALPVGMQLPVVSRGAQTVGIGNRDLNDRIEDQKEKKVTLAAKGDIGNNYTSRSLNR